MPTLSICTNLPLPKPAAVALVKKLSAAVAKSTGKPESYVCVSLRPDVALVFGGSDAPAAHAELVSIGGLGSKNAAHSLLLSTILQKELGVPPDRLYITFTDKSGGDMGYNGGTF